MSARRPYLQATPRYATPLPKPSRALFHFVELAVLVAGLVVFGYVVLVWAPG